MLPQAKRKNISVTNKNEIQFSHTVSGQEGPEVVFRASDSSGNTTEGTIVLETLSLAQADSARTASKRQAIPILYAALMGDTATDAIGLNHVKHSTVKPAGAGDTTPPFIKFKNRVKEKQTVYYDSFFIEGKVKDAGGVVSLIIKDDPILIRPGVKIHFNYLLKLEEDPNEIVIIVNDASGNSTKKIIVVERKIPAIHQISSRPATAVLPFQDKGDVDTFTSIVPDSLLNALSDRNRFNVVEREYLEAILAEQKLSSSDLADKSKALRLRKIVSAELVIGGSVKETFKSLQIYAGVIDTETSEVVVSTDVYGEEMDIEAFEYLIGGACMENHEKFSDD